ncbi:protein kinase domain protein [Ichthyophthirius multifiliis]|uniref:Protein kinase domain protein n=1 Tax=Ichthyophthirius multifiliis TaxID=5932 RepID=G0R2C2_ICHMU|nr:protein kinase domain protein [Ichthyophthirius multifiliis]EGR28379.1 protein kinase domain protein [Ichthyophthirius multifiliis]|eukprot:XP_004027724.1 protein kinase domain protein [Ichthyophthirius multifiliis]
MGNICDPYCSCSCEDQKVFRDCRQCFQECFNCDGCQQFTSCDYRLMNPCLIREVSNKDLMQILKEFDYQGEIDDQWYGEIQLLEHKIQKELICLKIIETSNEQEFEQIQQSFVRRLKLNNENIVRLRYIISKSVDTFCSVLFKSYLFFDFIITDLEKEIKHRQKKDIYFTEEEIWNLVYGIINGMRYFSSISLPHSCLRTKHIYVSQTGQYKVADPGLFNYETSYDIVFNNREAKNKGILLSPALIYGLERNIENPIHDQVKSDVFCAGMIILEAASLKNSSKCLDFYNYQIMEDLIENRLNNVKEKYHDSLYYLVKEMININELQRPDFQTLFEKNTRNLRFKQHIVNNLQAHFAAASNDNLSDSVSVLNQSFISNKGGKKQNINNNFNNNFNNNIVVSKPFDNNVSIIDNTNNILPNFGVSNQQNFDNNNNFGIGLGLGQYSMPVPLMSMNNNFLSGLDYVGSTMNNTKIPREKVIETYNNGSKYEGEVKNGLRDGKGKYYYNNGGYYEGQWKDGQMNGQGTLYFPDGQTAYDGQWRNDKFQGYGVLYNNTIINSNQYFDCKNFNNLGDFWTKYEGDFKQDQKDGFGTLYLSNGEKYVGGFKSNKIQGQGTFYTMNGQVIKGSWTNNIKVI